MAFFADTHAAQNTFGARVSAWWAGVKQENQRRRLMRTTYNELAVLSDRELSDLGLSRSDLGRIAREAAYGA